MKMTDGVGIAGWARLHPVETTEDMATTVRLTDISPPVTLAMAAIAALKVGLGIKLPAVTINQRYPVTSVHPPNHPPPLMRMYAPLVRMNVVHEK